MSHWLYTHTCSPPHSSEDDRFRQVVPPHAQAEGPPVKLWSSGYLVQTANAYTSYEHGTNNIYQHSMPGYSSTSNLDLTAQMLAMNTDIIPSPHNIEAPLPETHENDYWQTGGDQLAFSNFATNQGIVHLDQMDGEDPLSINNDLFNPHVPAVHMEHQIFIWIPETGYQCLWQDCRKIFTSRHRVKTHFNNFHALASGGERVLYTCDQCGEYTTPYKSAIPRHQRSQKCINNSIRRQSSERIFTEISTNDY